MVRFRYIIVNTLHKGDNKDYYYYYYYYYYYAEGVVTKNFLQYLENIDLTKNILSVAQKAVILQTCLIVSQFLGQLP